MSYKPQIPLRKKPWPGGYKHVEPCVICGEPWWPWAGSRLPCHARCLFDKATRKLIWEDPRTVKDLAKACGVPQTVITAARRLHLKERCEPRG